jgi:hypothetical protein
MNANLIFLDVAPDPVSPVMVAGRLILVGTDVDVCRHRNTWIYFSPEVVQKEKSRDFNFSSSTKQSKPAVGIQNFTG